MITEDSTMDSAMEALGERFCYIFSKIPNYRDTSIVWQNIHQVIGNMSSLSEKTIYIDIENDS